jgi:HSP20 family molecular chaperone IbpA
MRGAGCRQGPAEAAGNSGVALSMLLQGGCGYENLRSIPVLAFERRIRSPVRPRITLALAGFSPEEITITAEQSTLTVEGRGPNKGDRDYLYQGIFLRPFSRIFNLADYVQVKDATFDKLKIALVRAVPEAMKPRGIASKSGNDNQQIE